MLNESCKKRCGWLQRASAPVRSRREEGDWGQGEFTCIATVNDGGEEEGSYGIGLTLAQLEQE